MPILSLGGTGVISVASHIIGREIKEMIAHFHEGNIREASRSHSALLEVFYGIFIATNPVPIKEALNLKGIQAGPCRPPLHPMSGKEYEIFTNILKRHKIID